MKDIIFGLLSLGIIVFTFIYIAGMAGNTIQAQRDCAKEYQLEGWTLHEAQQRCATRRDIWE
jgi:hypothetical protein